MKHHVIITIYCEPYTPANESETLQQLMDQKRELVTLSLCLHAVGKLSAQAAEYGVIHYWLTEWMRTMCVSERSGSPSELHDWPLGEDTALPPIYLRNAAGSDKTAHK